MDLSGTLASSLAVTLFVSAAAVAHAGSDRYRLDAKLLHDGKPFAETVMTVNDSEPATIEMAGAEAFKLAITATGVDAETVRIEADLESAHGSMQPMMIVRTGEPASVTVGDLRVDLKVARPGTSGSP